VRQTYQYLVSACLAGVCCRYDGSSHPVEYVKRLVESGKALPVCPELLAGLPCPRMPVEIVEEKGERAALQKDSVDVTELFEKGAQLAARQAQLYNIKEAILKSHSPCCGYGEVYDGSFSGKRKEGNGFLAEALLAQGVKIKTQS
jgi:uncharacterized protein YbbK (DUF523 family)